MDYGYSEKRKSKKDLKKKRKQRGYKRGGSFGVARLGRGRSRFK